MDSYVYYFAREYKRSLAYNGSFHLKMNNHRLIVETMVRR